MFRQQNLIYRHYKAWRNSREMFHPHIFKGYNCIPEWNNPINRDPFDYPLRTRAEVSEELKQNPVKINAVIEFRHYYGGNKLSYDARNYKVKADLDMKDWNLTEKQRERLIFLLGPRYNSHLFKGDKDKFRIIVNQYGDFALNAQKLKDIVYELFYECKRAP